MTGSFLTKFFKPARSSEPSSPRPKALSPSRAATRPKAATKQKAPRRRVPRDGDFGGSALEYLIVSLFSLLLAIAAIHFVGKVIKKHAADIEAKAGISLELPEIFGDS